MEKIIAVYHITAANDDIDAVARDIAFEQTVEVPEALVTSARIRREIVGEVAAVEPVPEESGVFRVRIHYNPALACDQLAQLLNLFYGNISIKKNIRLVDFELPDSLLARFRGPNWGITGLRRLIGIRGRPLLATAIKPRGAEVAQLADIAYRFALGGGDLIKDDHNLVDADFDAFRHRVEKCQQAVQRANRETGGRTLYFPHILAPAEMLEAQFRFVAQLGIRGVLVSPLLLGIDTVRRLADQFRLAVMAHPAFAGTFFHDPRHGIEPGVLLGRLFRLMGADATIFPNRGGRFRFTDEDCMQVRRRLQEPWGKVAPAWPAPAGGMRFESLEQMAQQYGEDAIFLIGGALLSHTPDLTEGTRRFRAQIEKLFPQWETTTEAPLPISACEWPAAGSDALRRHLPFQADFRWGGRTPVEYKSGTELPFRHVSRQELIGRHGEQTGFDLRYFEIGAGGYSSLEKHHHTHAIICLRGRGELQIDEEVIPLQPYDIAYVPPLAVHQLRNCADEPFGFFCIVDHDRDRPMKP